MAKIDEKEYKEARNSNSDKRIKESDEALVTQFNQKDARIWKLADKGLTVAQIVRKIGSPNDLKRVEDALTRRKR